MTWYAALLTMQTQVDGVPKDGYLPVVESSIRLIHAADESGAMSKAQALLKEAEHQYLNDAGEVIRWIGVSVDEVQEIGAERPGDGDEIFSSMRREVAGANQ